METIVPQYPLMVIFTLGEEVPAAFQMFVFLRLYSLVRGLRKLQWVGIMLFCYQVKGVSMLGGRHHGVLSEPEKMAHVQNPPDSGNTHLRNVPGLDGKKVVQIYTGSEHSAIVTEDGEIYTWGWGEHGQLGHGNTIDSTLPRCVNLHNVDSHSWLTSKVYCGSGFTFAIRTRCQQ